MAVVLGSVVTYRPSLELAEATGQSTMPAIVTRMFGTSASLLVFPKGRRPFHLYGVRFDSGLAVAHRFSELVGLGPDVMAPTITSTASHSVAEDTAYSATATANETVTWAKGGTDAALVTLNTSTGTWSVAAQDYATKPSVVFTLTATDTAANISTPQTVTLTITEAASPPAFLGDTTPSGTAGSPFSMSLDDTNEPCTPTLLPSGDGEQFDIGGDTIGAAAPAEGVYTFTIRFTSDSTGLYTDVVFTLTITAGADVTAPTLTSPAGTETGAATATLSVTTNEANGTLYSFVSTSATPPSAADLKAGTGAVFANNQAITTTGAKTASATGLTAATAYYAHWLHRDAAGNDSTIATSASFTTEAGGGSLLDGSESDGTQALNFGVDDFITGDVTKTNNAMLAPDGTTTAALFTVNATNERHFGYRTFTAAANTTRKHSIYVKPNGERYIQISLGVGSYAFFDTTDHVVTDSLTHASDSALTTLIEQGENGFWKYTAQCFSTVEANPGYGVFALSNRATMAGGADNSGNPQYTGDGTSGQYWWRAKVVVT